MMRDQSARASILPRKIDDVFQWAPVRERRVIGEEMRNNVLRHERPADMRGDRDVGIAPEGVTERQRLGRKDIQGGVTDNLRPDGI